MLLFHDPRCTDYGDASRPEQPDRLARTVPRLTTTHPEWEWRTPLVTASREDARLAHTDTHLDRLTVAQDFDADTPWFDEIDAHAYRATACALAATDAAVDGTPAISLMRPPGHHATAETAMGFCYLNHIAIAALHARRRRGLARVAVWDFDAHHGNGTEAILADQDGFLFTSVHQSPCYPGTGTRSFSNCLNWPIPPMAPVDDHLAALRESLDRVIAFAPDLVLVSAGFDAYEGDPITSMTLQIDQFATLGSWLRATELPAAAVLEGGYSRDLPALVDAFLSAWAGRDLPA